MMEGDSKPDEALNQTPWRLQGDPPSRRFGRALASVSAQARERKLSVAEGEGFEPSIRFWRIHTFQACAFNRSATCPEGAGL